jgi:hypothetical protein
LRKVLALFHVKKSSKWLLYLLFRFWHGLAHPVLIKQGATVNHPHPQEIGKIMIKLIFYAVFIKKINRDNNPAPLLPLERIGNYTFSISSFDNPVIFEINSKVGI